MLENARIPRIHRVSIDLDTFNQFKMLKVYYNMKLLTDYVTIYETGHGYHIMGYFKNVTPEINLHIRTMLGDCANRLELDNDRNRYNQPEIIETLFSNKRINKRNTKEILFNIFSNPFYRFDKENVNNGD